MLEEIKKILFEKSKYKKDKYKIIIKIIVKMINLPLYLLAINAVTAFLVIIILYLV